MRAFDRDLIRGGHYGQRSCEPHKQAEHMAAPTQACDVRKKSLPTRSRPHMALSGLAEMVCKLSALRGEADMRDRVTSTSSVAIDPQETLGRWYGTFFEAWPLAKLDSMERSIPNHAVGRANDPTCGESDAVFPWWSITKTVFAAAVLRLADSGRLSLDNLYRERPYTIRQLLQHTAGLNTYGGPPYRAAVAAGDPIWPVAELLARVKADRLIFDPGKGWAYSNVGYLFVRQLIEETVDMEINEALRVLVFEPMGIHRTRIAS